MDIEAYLGALDAHCEPLLQSITEHTVPGELSTLTGYAAALHRACAEAKQATPAKPENLGEYIRQFEIAQRVDQALLVAVVCEEYARFASRVLTTGIRR